MCGPRLCLGAVFESCLVGVTAVSRAVLLFSVWPQGETTACGTVELDVHGTVEQCTGEYPSCSTLAHDLNRLIEVVVNN